MPTPFVGPEETQLHPHLRPLSFVAPFVSTYRDQSAIEGSDPQEADTSFARQEPLYPFDRPFYYMAKRLLDLLVIIVALGFLLPLLLLIAIAIKVDSAGPIFVAQVRIGVRRCRRQGKMYWEQTPFLLYRFRTTVYQPLADQPHGWSVAPLTGVGRFLSQSSLEQLPQLWNIIKGELTLVGPRPLLPAGTNKGNRYAPRVLKTMPGMIGLWSAIEQHDSANKNGYGDKGVPVTEMGRLDHEYVEKQSLLLDLRLLLSALKLFCDQLWGKCTKS